jgi:heterokaryon incompatibility protein (HET)
VLHDLQCADDGYLKITPNLQDALSDLQLDTEPRQLWVNAICIDQENDTERSEQVSIMRQIYKNAKKTIAYVGKEDEHSPLAVRYLNDLSW